MRHPTRRTLVSAAVAAVAGLAIAAPGPGRATLISLGETGVQGNNDSYEGSVANNGKIVAFYSLADNLVADDDNADWDVFVRDLRTGKDELVSRDGFGNPGTSWSYYPTLSANGRWVMYYTRSENIASGANEAGNRYQAVVTDRRTGDTVEVSIGFDGGPADGSADLYDTRPLSGNGRYAVFCSGSTDIVQGDTNGFFDVFLADLRAGTVERISNGIAGEADGQSRYPSISPNGRWVIYCSQATNLVAGDANGFWDVFLYDVKRKTTTLVSLGTGGTAGNGNSGGTSEQATAVSNNGRWAVFASAATNLDSILLDTNGFGDVFLRDLREGTTKRISLGPAGAQADNRSADPWVDPSGRRVSYYTYAGNLVDATDPIPYDQLVYDVRTGTTVRTLQALAGGPTNGGNYGYWNGMSPNGRWHACTSDGSNIVDVDVNAQTDVFLVDLK